MSGEYSTSETTKKGYYAGITWSEYKEIEYAIIDGRAVFEGDIIIGTEESIAAAEREGTRRISSDEVLTDLPAFRERGMVVRGIVVVGTHYRWPNGVIPYTIDSNLPNQWRIHDAISHWKQNTVIRFVQRTTENDFVKFIPSDGCWSYVGRQGGEQEIGLAAGCLTGSTIHEIGHAVGLWHEQSREDRDDYVTIHYENILDSKAHNFNQHITDGDDVGPYDYASIMHYPRKAFSKNGQDTITPTQEGVEIGQRTGLSSGDKSAVSYMYGARKYTLSVNIVGKGAISLNPEQETYDQGNTVQLTANPESGWRFSGWSGDLTGSANPINIIMDDDKVVEATFTRQICFVATVALGSMIIPHVQFLRVYRDEIILKSVFKNRFEQLLDRYYRFSPYVVKKMEVRSMYKKFVKYLIAFPFVLGAKVVLLSTRALANGKFNHSARV